MQLKIRNIGVFGLTLLMSNNAYSQDFDIDAAPKILANASMPAGATASGKCDISFDVDTEGTAKNIIAKACTDEVFYLPSIRAIQKSSFTPAMKAGQPVIREGIIHPVQFNLLDEAGNSVPVSIANLYYPPSDEVFSPESFENSQPVPKQRDCRFIDGTNVSGEPCNGTGQPCSKTSRIFL